MKDIQWSPILSVEVNEIDEDHRKLVGIFNILNHAVGEQASADYVEAVLEELISCTVWHFRHEERLMLGHGYPGLAEHKAEHDELIESARALQESFSREGRQVSGEQLEFLERWLTGHILAADMKLGAFLAEAM